MFGKNSKVDAVASSVMQVIEKVTTDTTKGREEGSINSFTPAKVTLKGDVEKKPDPKEPQETTARKSIEAKSVKSEETVQEVSPPGWSGTVKAMKKHKNISNPFALAWSMKNKGAKSHIKAEEYVDESVLGALKTGAKKVLAKVGGGSDEDMKKDLQRKMGIPQTGKVGMAKQNEETEQIDEKVISSELQTIQGNHVVNSQTHTHPDAKHGVSSDTLVHKGTISSKGGSNKKKFEIHNHPNHGLVFKTNHTDDEKQSIKKHLIYNKMAGKGTAIHEEVVEEGWDDMVKAAKDSVKSGPKPNGGSGKKQGSAYGGSKQKDKPEQDVKEGYEDSAEDKAEDKKEAKKRHMSMKEWEKSAADKKEDMKEAKTLSPGQDDAPFDAPMSTTPRDVKDKSGAVHTPMSRARNLARAAMSKIKKDHKLG